MDPIHNTAVSLHLLFFCFIFAFDFNRELLQCLHAAPSFVPCHTWSGTPSSISIPTPKACRQFVPVLALHLAELWVSVSSHLPCPTVCRVGGSGYMMGDGGASYPWRYQVSSQHLSGLWNIGQGKPWSRKHPRGILSSSAVQSRIF